MRRFGRIIKNERGATAVEYGLILALIFLAMVVAVAALGVTTRGLWGDVSGQVRNSA